jgi:hypothetical protein
MCRTCPSGPVSWRATTACSAARSPAAGSGPSMMRTTSSTGSPYCSCRSRQPRLPLRPGQTSRPTHGHGRGRGRGRGADTLLPAPRRAVGISTVCLKFAGGVCAGISWYHSCSCHAVDTRRACAAAPPGWASEPRRARTHARTHARTRARTRSSTTLRPRSAAPAASASTSACPHTHRGAHTSHSRRRRSVPRPRFSGRSERILPGEI